MESSCRLGGTYTPPPTNQQRPDLAESIICSAAGDAPIHWLQFPGKAYVSVTRVVSLDGIRDLHKVRLERPKLPLLLIILGFPFVVQLKRREIICPHAVHTAIA